MADDPLADMQNILGYQGLTGPNSYLLFTGQYPFGQGAPVSSTGQAQPGFAQFNTGAFGDQPPTDANGKPIQSFVDESNRLNAQYAKQLADYNAAKAAAPAGGAPGTTLNSTPGPPAPSGYGPLDALVQGVAQAQAGKQSTPYGLAGTNPYATAAAGGATPQQLAGMFSQMSPTIPYSQDSGVRGGTPAPAGVTNPNYANRIGALMAGIGPGQGAAGANAPAAPPPPTPANLHDAYLTALSNPGPLTPVGAAPPGPGQTPTGTPGPSVMQAFLAANPKGTPFVNALRGLQNG